MTPRPSSNPQRISKKNGRSGIRPGWSPVPASRFLGNEVASINLPLRLSGRISPLYPVGRGWKMGRHGRDQSLSYLLAELESSNPQRIFPASGFLGKTYALRLSGCISPIPCGLGWRMGRHDPTPRPSAKDFEKNGRSGIRPGWSPVLASRFLGNEVASINLFIPLRLSGCISPLYPVGRGDGEWEDMTETNPYRICWRSWRVAIRKRFLLLLDSLAKPTRWRLSGCISPIPCGLGWRMGRHDPETERDGLPSARLVQCLPSP